MEKKSLYTTVYSENNVYSNVINYVEVIWQPLLALLLYCVISLKKCHYSWLGQFMYNLGNRLTLIIIGVGTSWHLLIHLFGTETNQRLSIEHCSYSSIVTFPQIEKKTALFSHKKAKSLT